MGGIEYQTIANPILKEYREHKDSVKEKLNKAWQMILPSVTYNKDVQFMFWRLVEEIKEYNGNEAMKIAAARNNLLNCDNVVLESLDNPSKMLVAKGMKDKGRKRKQSGEVKANKKKIWIRDRKWEEK